MNPSGLHRMRNGFLFGLWQTERSVIVVNFLPSLFVGLCFLGLSRDLGVAVFMFTVAFVFFSSRVTPEGVVGSFGVVALRPRVVWDDVVQIVPSRVWIVDRAWRFHREGASSLDALLVITRAAQVGMMRELVASGLVPADRVEVPEKWRGRGVEALREAIAARVGDQS
jgi:hypothetical protein